MSKFRLSRRSLVASASAAGIGMTKEAVARGDLLSSNIDWFEGRLIAVSASGDTRDICGVRGYTCRRRTSGWYFDAGDASIGTMISPLTGAIIKPEPFTFETAGDVSVVEVNGFLSFEETSRIEISGVPGTLTARRAAHIMDVQKPSASIPVIGHWTLVVPWLPWLRMSNALGHCQFDCRIGGGVADVADLPARFQRAIS